MRSCRCLDMRKRRNDRLVMHMPKMAVAAGEIIRPNKDRIEAGNVEDLIDVLDRVAMLDLQDDSNLFVGTFEILIKLHSILLCSTDAYGTIADRWIVTCAHRRRGFGDGANLWDD